MNAPTTIPVLPIPALPNHRLALGGFPVVRTTTQALIPALAQTMRQQQITLLFANTNFVVKCQPFATALSTSDTLIVNDGIGLDIASWLVHRRAFIENLNGTDFTPRLLEYLGTEARVFLLGAKPGIAQRAAEALSQQLGITPVGVRNGYDEAKNSEELISDINASDANVVLVAMGNPYQEAWILKHRHRLNASLLMGVGALFDFLAGDKQRAPQWVQRLRLEWFYRLCLEPSRLLRRYTLDIVQFLWICLRRGRQLTVIPSGLGLQPDHRPHSEG